ncbi:MAG: 16S rRNA (cytosine(967)-C(5))-methyltransferase RsmB [Gemmatimonadaceae bacterium]|nr:16S rRNA (cytosine(967)-C(5))-methyltransferase RsmB [Gemmatimonadaceae bacterium]
MSSVTDARAAAAEIAADMRRGDLLDLAFERRAGGLEARDRRWTQELVYGMLRRRGVIDAWLGNRVRGGLVRLDADVADLLRLGAYQILSMGSVPAYAGIAQTVEQVKRRHGIGASKLANAVLRRLDRERQQLDGELLGMAGDPVDILATRLSHPRWLVARWIARWGEAETMQLLAANNAEAPIVVRPWGIVREQLEAMFDTAGISHVEAPLVGDGLQLTSPVALAELGAWRQGMFFVQDPAATLVSRYAAIAPGSTVLDACAAPGGKALELSRHAGRVIAADKSEARLARVRQNLARLDVRNVFPAVADAREAPVAPVDAVLVDAPCTGTGTFRRHPDARWRLKVSDLAVSASAQRQILRACADVVRPGGLLIYSTCSLEPEENDQQVEQFLRDQPEFTLEPPPPGAVPSVVLDAGRLRVLPQRHGVDGAFAARLRRQESRSA